MNTTKEKSIEKPTSGDKGKETYRNETSGMTSSTATNLLMCAFTSINARQVLAVHSNLEPGDFPTPQHLNIWRAITEQANRLEAANEGHTLVSAELVSTELLRTGRFDENVSAILNDALGTVRGGHALPPSAAHHLARALRRDRLAAMCLETAELFKVAAQGSDVDVLRALEYAQLIPGYATRAGVTGE